VRDCLRRTRIFVSGNVAEGFGITYLEALTQGCIVAMPASGGGWRSRRKTSAARCSCFPLSLGRSEILATLRRAMHEQPRPVDTAPFTAGAAVEAFLAVDAGRAAGKVILAEVRT